MQEWYWTAMNTVLFYMKNKVRVKGRYSFEIDKSARVRRCFISVKGNNNRLIIKKGANVSGTRIEICGDNCSIVIGENCHVGENCYLSSRERSITLSIGDDSSLARNVKVMTSDGHSITQNKKRVNPAKSIIIGDHVWIADGAVVLKGCSIGDNSIIGLHSLVTKNIGDHKIAVGNPAVEVKHNVDWEDALTY